MAEMYSKAWQRELGRWAGRFYNWGHHHIDVLVVSTQHMRKAADDLERSRGDYAPLHRWAGDGTDDPSTMTSDVLITPEQLASLVARAELGR